MLARLTELFSPLRDRSVRLLLSASVVSGIGDWAARLALSVLVYERSDSALWAALVIAVSLLPWLGPGQMLATVADRVGRVTVMIVADVARAALFLLLLVPLPLPLVLLVAFAAGMFTPPFTAARSAATVEVVPPELYGRTLALIGTVFQFELLVGYMLGGVLVAAAGVEVALVVNAMSFLVSALLVAPLRGSAASTRHASAVVGWAGVVAGVRLWRSDRLRMRALALVVLVTSMSALPEALVVPLAAETGVPISLAGVLVAAGAFGALVTTALLPHLTGHWALLRSAARRAALAASISAALFVVVAVLSTADVDVWVVVVAAVAAYMVAGGVDVVGVQTHQVVGERLPAEGRAGAMSVGQGSLQGGQALAIGAAGLLTLWLAVPVVLAVALCFAVAVSLWSLLHPIADFPVDTPEQEVEV